MIVVMKTKSVLPACLLLAVAPVLAIPSYCSMAQEWTDFFHPDTVEVGIDSLPILIFKGVLTALGCVAAIICTCVGLRIVCRKHLANWLTKVSGLLALGSLLIYLIVWLYSITISINHWGMLEELTQLGTIVHYCFGALLLGVVGFWVSFLLPVRRMP